MLLPQAIADHLDDGELEAIMLHELVHIRRRDNLVGNLQMAVCALLWFHPLVWLISNKLFDERELACDEEVLKLRAAPETYAAGILKVVRFSLGWRVAGVTGAGNGSNLRRRIENIMTTNNTKHRAAVWHRLFAGTLVGFAIVVALVAGFHTRARAVNAVVGTQSVQAVGRQFVTDIVDPVDQIDPLEGQQDKSKTVQPPQPPQPAQPAQPVTAGPNRRSRHRLSNRRSLRQPAQEPSARRSHGTDSSCASDRGTRSPALRPRLQRKRS